jgi:hypothetical protein
MAVIMVACIIELIVKVGIMMMVIVMMMMVLHAVSECPPVLTCDKAKL